MPESIRGWLPVVCLLAFSGLGCGGGSKHSCTPDLTVNWAIVISGSNTSASCSDVGATNIRVTIDGQSMDFVCPAAQSSGSIPAQLDVSGSHAVSITLLSGTSPLGQPASTTINVDCSGLTETHGRPLKSATGAGAVKYAPGGRGRPSHTLPGPRRDGLGRSANTPGTVYKR